MIPRDKRFVFLAQLDIKSKSKDNNAPNISLDEVIVPLKSMIDNGEAIYERDKKSKIFQLTQYKDWQDTRSCPT